jgi:hypothetical protein
MAGCLPNFAPYSWTHETPNLLLGSAAQRGASAEFAGFRVKPFFAPNLYRAQERGSAAREAPTSTLTALRFLAESTWHPHPKVRYSQLILHRGEEQQTDG